jgi:CheY-like chemotaxis protein
VKLSEARVLVVDDEAALREIFARWLHASGCLQVETAENGQEAIDAIQKSTFDVLITDVRMPVMDGVSLVRRLAELGKRIPCIIFVSAFGEVDQREMYNLGVEAFLAKPFRLEELAAVLENAIADRSALWQTPMPIPPRQSVSLELGFYCPAGEDCPQRRPEMCVAVECFRLGRGGFSARFDGPVGLGKVSFQCNFHTEPGQPAIPAMSGEGFVRWRSRSEQTIGVEFAYLDPPGRQWVVEQIAATNPSSFVPALGR